jgi:hypothetical protein
MPSVPLITWRWESGGARTLSPMPVTGRTRRNLDFASLRRSNQDEPVAPHRVLGASVRRYQDNEPNRRLCGRCVRASALELPETSSALSLKRD